MDETRQLASFVADTGFDHLPVTVVERIKTYVLDCIACGFIGSPQPWAGIVADMVHEVGGAGDASMFMLPWKAPTSQAALVNGVMIGGFESEHVGHVSHPAGTVFPAALAIAERDHLSGKQFLTALAVGYEVVCRIGDAQTGAVEVERGFHNPAANGPFSAAAAVGKLLELDAETIANALGIAGSSSGGLVEYAWHGEMTKRLHLGRASQLGLESALLAQRGFTGPTTIIEGPYGYLHAFSPSPKVETLLEGLGTDWRMQVLTIKAYPCHVTSQAVVAAIQAFKRDRHLDPSTVERVRIKASHRMLENRFLDRAPTSMMGAQYSLAFTTATAIHRNLDMPIQYDVSTLSDPGICDLAQRITWEEVDADKAAVVITVAGKAHELPATTYSGAANNPASFDVVVHKFRRFTQHALAEDEQNTLVNQVSRLESLEDVSEIATLIRLGNGRNK